MKELTQEQTVAQTIERLKKAMLENIEASRAETEAQIRKRKAHYELIKAQEEVRGIQMDLMSGLNI